MFDVYTGEQTGEGRKSLAYTLRFRAPDRTLTDDEVAVARDAAVAEATDAPAPSSAAADSWPAYSTVSPWAPCRLLVRATARAHVGAA